MMQKTSLGEYIHTLRRRKGLTCHQLAQKAGVSAATISRVERGMEPEFKHVIAIARALGMTPIGLLRGLDLEADVAIWKGDRT